MSCNCGGWVSRRHDAVNAEVVRYAARSRGTADKECVLSYASDKLPQARLDTILRFAASAGRAIIDITVVSPLTQEMLRHGVAARVPGAAETAAANHKRAVDKARLNARVAEHHQFWSDIVLDEDNQYHRVPEDFYCPFSVPPEWTKQFLEWARWRS